MYVIHLLSNQIKNTKQAKPAVFYIKLGFFSLKYDVSNRLSKLFTFFEIGVISLSYFFFLSEIIAGV